MHIDSTSADFMYLSERHEQASFAIVHAVLQYSSALTLVY